MSESAVAPTHGDDEFVLDESIEDDQSLVDIGESTLSYFGADFDVAGLVRRLNDEDIVIPRFDPDESEDISLDGFQRQRVWTRPRMEQFIESLLLGWPVPSIFLVLEPDQRYLVLDGQQRLSALQFFYAGELPDGRTFALHDVADHLKGATYSTLNKESRRRLNNTFIQATVIEPQGDGGRESVYTLFGRLNSGGITLTPQEIRVALYRGPIIDLIRVLNSIQQWRILFGQPNKRLKDHEMILRSLAMIEVLDQIGGRWGDDGVKKIAYSPPMSDYLNKYLERHRKLEGLDSDAVREAFGWACDLLVRSVGSEGVRFNGRLNAAHIDAVLSTLMRSRRQAMEMDVEAVKRGLAKLRADEDYAGFVTTGTSHRESVTGRLEKAEKAFMEAG